IGLSGEVRAVGQTEARLKEAAKLGFKRSLAPPRRNGAARAERIAGIETTEIARLIDLLAVFGPGVASHRGVRRAT
ncbi:MAG TPA: DNA repair protein RadA, partial [Alphaproteobacteria bacterium]|nr:DNA repair protein RadA [Alphaproteobacteria bacterium]